MGITLSLICQLAKASFLASIGPYMQSLLKFLKTNLRCFSGGNDSQHGSPNGGHQDALRLMESFQHWFNELIDSWNQETSEFRLEVTRFADSKWGRLLLSSPFWMLSVRYTTNEIELYRIHACQLSLLEEEEVRSKLRLKLIFDRRHKQWTTDGLAISNDEIRAIVRTNFRDFIHATMVDVPIQEGCGSSYLTVLEASMAGKMRDMVTEKHELAQKIVNQQEQLQNEIARELHDTVIGNLLTLTKDLKRGNVPTEEIIERILATTHSLRQACSSLAPRDIHDWGLITVLDDLLRNINARTGIDCNIDAGELPPIEPEVELHIYRIVQECLTNAEKHANATRIKVSAAVNEQRQLCVSIDDNGTGMAAEISAKRKIGESRGLSIMRERVDLIRAHHNAQLSINSSAEHGTCISLVIDLETCNGETSLLAASKSSEAGLTGSPESTPEV